jgi:hypothetical protein
MQSPGRRSARLPPDTLADLSSGGRLHFFATLLLTAALGALLGGGSILTLLGGSAEQGALGLYAVRDEAPRPAVAVADARNHYPAAAAFAARVEPDYDVQIEADDAVQHVGAVTNTLPVVKPVLPGVRLRDDPAARQRFWHECLDSVEAAECRPDPASGMAPLGFHEWNRHVRELLETTARFRDLPPHAYRHAKFNSSAYAGPWVENKWIEFFYGNSAWEGMYPLVPLFVQWTDALHGGNPALYDEAVSTLLGPGGPLRADVVYVTVMQLDRVPKEKVIDCAKLRNVVVLGAGGWGNVALPLLKGETARMDANLWPPETDPVQHWPRKAIFNAIVDHTKFNRYSIMPAIQASLGNKEYVNFWPFDVWQWVTHSAIYIGSMWGRDRASFRLYENIRYGRITLHIYQDEPWLPYQHSYDFLPPGTTHGRLGPGGERDVRAFGAVLQSPGASQPDGTSLERSYDDTQWDDAVDGAVWGAGGYGFAVHVDQLPAFFCVACEFLQPGSAAKWRHVRALPLHRYGPDKACPCSPAAWAASLAALGSPKNYTIPRGSLVYEMERRAMRSADKYFSYDAVVRHMDALFIDPSAAALKCVPRPATFHPTARPLPRGAARQ